ncbi:motility associated factor glycosyltransferase family protein [Sutcliffiella halmapala]|uniref:motility associated factor glycosyltransferase family protein n=1 Tax=Sutcliffiella halmapala TaxID=79882 RepID=UPI000994DD67|nr:6-hydroxymethylpterin diphosphokinase MptE-like protein [Sutcliffiella halmapala]
MNFELVNTRTKPTIKGRIGNEIFYLHSKYNPLVEAERWASGIDKKKKQAELMIIGMGAGHHIRALLNEVQVQKINIYDFNDVFSSWIKKSGLIDDLILSEKVEYHSIKTPKDLGEFALSLNENMIVYEPALKIFSVEFEVIKNKIENYIIQERTIIDQKDQFFQNFVSNLKIKDPGITKYRGINKTSMILVSAGPSLTKQLPTLKKAYLSKRYVIGVVGTAFKPLMNYGIVPNFVMISDPKDEIVEQFQGYETESTSLFYLSTANRHAVSSFKGSRYIVWQEGFQLSEEEAAKRGEPLVKTGGSVATCLLDLMIVFGANKIALVGQDLAFTDGKSHAEHTHALRDITQPAFLREIPNYYQNGSVYTSRNLSVYLAWFEKYVAGKNSIEFWNCTEGGAYIEGWNHRPFNEF